MAKSIIINLDINTKDGKDSLGELNKGAKTTLSTLRDLEDAAKLLQDELRHTQAGTKEFKELNKELKKVQDGIKDINSEDMSFTDQLAELPGIAGLAGQSIQGLGGAMSLLAANPIIAILGALVAILKMGIDRMKETQSGTEAISAVMAGLSAALKPIMDAFAKIAGILIEMLMPVLELLAPILEGIGWVFSNVVAPVIEFVADAFKALVEGIKDALTWLGLMDGQSQAAVKSAEALAKAELQLVAAKKKLEVQNAKDLRSIEQLKNVRDNELKSMDDRIQANEEIKTIEEARIARAIAFNQQELKVKKALLAADKDNIELQNAVIDLEVEHQDLLSQSDGIMAEYISNRQALIREELGLLKTRLDGQTAVAEAERRTESEIYAIRKSSISQQIALLKSRGATELSEYKDLLNELAVLNAEWNSELKERNKEASREITDIRIEEVRNQFEKERQLASEELKRYEEDLKIKGKLTEQELALVEERRAATARAIERINIEEREFLQSMVATTQQINAEIEKVETERAMQAEIRALTQAKREALLTAKNEDAKNRIVEQYQRDENAIRRKYLQERINDINALKDEQLKALDLDEQAALRVAATEEEKNKIYKEYAKKRIDIEKGAQDQIDSITSEALDNTATNAETSLSRFADKAIEIVGIVNGFLQQALGVLAAMFEEQAAREDALRQERFEKEDQTNKNLLANRLISQEEYDNRLKELNREKEQEEKQARLKAFKQQKAFNIVNAIMTTAQAVLAGLATVPFLPMGPIMAGVAGALGAAQIAVIASQQFKGNRGGVVPGTASKVDSVDAKLAPGEMVINSESSMMFPQLLSAINQAGGGIPLAPEPVMQLVGGGGSNIYERNGGRMDVRAYVVEQDISSSQTRAMRMRNSATY